MGIIFLNYYLNPEKKNILRLERFINYYIFSIYFFFKFIKLNNMMGESYNSK